MRKYLSALLRTVRRRQSLSHRSWPNPYDPSAPRQETILKLLSQDPANYKDAPTEGIRRLLEQITGQTIPRGSPLPTEHIGEPRHSISPLNLSKSRKMVGTE